MVNFPWSKKDDSAALDRQAAITQSILQGDGQRTTSELEMQRDLGTNFHMTEAPELMEVVRSLAARMYDYPVEVDEATGKVLKTERRVWYHPVFTTLYIEVNRLHGMRWLDPVDAEIAMWQVKYNFKKQKMKLSPQEYSQWGGVVDALERLALGAISDSLNGRKPKLLKVQPRTFEVQFHKPAKPGQEQESRGFMP